MNVGMLNRANVQKKRFGKEIFLFLWQPIVPTLWTAIEPRPRNRFLHSTYMIAACTLHRHKGYQVLFLCLKLF